MQQFPLFLYEIWAKASWHGKMKYWLKKKRLSSQAGVKIILIPKS